MEAPAPAAGAGRGASARDELKLCGLAAVRARFARDPASIQRLYFDRETGRRIGVICKVLAQAKRIYRQVEPIDLERIAGSVHHGGIVAVVAAPRLPPVTPDVVRKWAAAREAVLLLDHIGNAHNLGAIARSAAHFGVGQLVLAADAGSARPTDAAYRVAEGGLEQVTVWLAPDLAGCARELVSAGYEVVGAATRGGRSDAVRSRASPLRPIALAVGSEESGLAPELAEACTRLVTIPGTGRVESLNVSVAAAVLMWEWVARPAR